MGISRDNCVLRAPYGEEIKSRSRVFATNQTMANTDTDRIPFDLKSDFAAIAAARPLEHLELLSLCPLS
jgi:hypothetical protein